MTLGRRDDRQDRKFLAIVTFLVRTRKVTKRNRPRGMEQIEKQPKKHK
jgi:hypothetical protein